MKHDKILDQKKTAASLKPISLVLIAFSLIFTGAFIGASTNIINGLVSPDYFKIIMGWNFSGIWLAAIVQGAFEGILYGIIFSLIYTVSFAFITKLKGDWHLAKNVLLKTIPVIYICWAIAGIIAILLAFTFWDGYDQVIRDVPQEILKRLGFAWVGGSIWGAMIGAIVAIPYSVIITTQIWMKTEQKTV